MSQLVPSHCGQLCIIYKDLCFHICIDDEGASCPYLGSSIKAHKAHTEVNRESHKVALHDAGVRFTLQKQEGEMLPTRATQRHKTLICSDGKGHVSLISLYA